MSTYESSALAKSCRGKFLKGIRIAFSSVLCLVLMTSISLSGLAYAAEQPPDMPGGGSELGGSEGGQPGGGSGGGGAGGADTQSFDYSGSYSATLVADGEENSADGQSIESSESDTNAALVQDAGTLDITDSTLVKSGDSSDDDSCNFYGINSILLAVGEESLARISNTSFDADSEGSNALFATDSAIIWANDIEISTSSDNSRGLDATYGGTVIVNEASISTSGDHSAGAATDRGGGYVSVANSVISTEGSGSPILYSTGAVEADGITGTATGSQIAGMEGLNTIRISNSTLESSITRATASDPIANGVIIYQSTSGDADTSTGERALFEVRDSSLSSAIESGSMFYLTNTSADIVLFNTELSFDSSAANLITVEGNDSNNWGTAGSNGADVTLTAHEQTLEGTVSVDTISSLEMYLVDSSTFTGDTLITENSVASTSDEPISITIENGSSWVVTGDSTVSNLLVEEGAQVVDESGNTVSIIVDGETVVSGDSDITVTVTNSYSTEIDTSGAVDLSDATVDRTDFDDYFGTSTAFGTGDNAIGDTADAIDSTSDGESGGGFFAWLAGIWDSFLSLFS